MKKNFAAIKPTNEILKSFIENLFIPSEYLAVNINRESSKTKGIFVCLFGHTTKQLLSNFEP